MSVGVNRDIVSRWQEAVLAVESGRLGDARSLLWEIRHFSAKIWYNLAVVHLMENEYSAADQKFEECLQRDGYLAVAHFQRGIIASLQGRLSEAQTMFARAQQNVRNGELIDYRQLGLALRLTQKQIEHNQAAVEMCIRRQPSAAKVPPEDLQMLPPVMFRPAKSLVDNLQKQQFLQKAKVVSSVPEIVQDTGNKLAGSSQSLSAPVSPSSQRRLCVPAANQQGPRTPPPRRPPPRLPQPSFSATTLNCNHSSVNSKRAVLTASQRGQGDESVSHSTALPASSLPAARVASSTAHPPLSASQRSRGDNPVCDNRPRGAVRPSTGSQLAVSSVGEVSSGAVSSLGSTHSHGQLDSNTGHGVEASPTVASVTDRISMLNSLGHAGTRGGTERLEGSSSGRSTSQQAVLQGVQQVEVQLVRGGADRDRRQVKPARPPPPKTSWPAGS